MQNSSPLGREQDREDAERLGVEHAGGEHDQREVRHDDRALHDEDAGDAANGRVFASPVSRPGSPDLWAPRLLSSDIRDVVPEEFFTGLAR